MALRRGLGQHEAFGGAPARADRDLVVSGRDASRERATSECRDRRSRLRDDGADGTALDAAGTGPVQLHREEPVRPDSGVITVGATPDPSSDAPVRYR